MLENVLPKAATWHAAAAHQPPSKLGPNCVCVQAYTTDPALLPVQYQCVVSVKEVGGVLTKDALTLTLFGTRDSTGGLAWAAVGLCSTEYHHS